MIGCRRCDYRAADRDDLAEHAWGSGHLLCIVCARSLEVDERQTCVRCLGAARRNLRTIVELYAMLPAETTDRGGTTFDPIGRGDAEAPMPGGDALVMLAGGSVSARDPEVRPDDPVPPLALLASWEDDWREFRGEPAGGRATMASVSSYLDARLGWAAQLHPAFDEFSSDLRRCRGQLETVLRAGEQELRAPAPCIECGGTLVQAYRDPKPCSHGHRPCGCDQGGLAASSDPHAAVWVCRDCDQGYTPEQYALALRVCFEHATSQW